ncbi:MAG: protein-methionine-sulfoxide reductase heme-binding subunit MsrQ [Tabrizicola sp.]|jgi:sulfoxide reductase heme-binding subunit YedZ|uniref:protein-methionine-sulfoxide reductase heme-binding subunit MsrQ n=1 Tax=Tabrizicola sp. TaxID=2005166 RepID=UPI001B51AF33|nr:protein-methionine-sulfoxide reductase heme-binding subunit MsrQ [Tabrizicola sp.]MCC6517416.1 protein-methionine-sulfoxide reductase heme-binding subunit MsrQ [Tabrizicola sp.]
MDRLNALARRVPTWVIYGLGLVPLGLLVWGAVFGGLGPDPVKAIERGLGERGLQFLLASLAITPLRRVGLNLVRFRRALGLLSFLYISLHLVAWVWLDMGLRWSEMLADLTKRPFVILGMIGFLVMIPLAATSWTGAIRRMGAAAWQRLHKLAYVAILAGVVHQALLSKVWTVEVLLYLGLGLGLLALRLVPKIGMGRRASA